MRNRRRTRLLALAAVAAAAPAVAGDQVFVGSCAGRFFALGPSQLSFTYAFDIATGTVAWKTDAHTIYSDAFVFSESCDGGWRHATTATNPAWTTRRASAKTARSTSAASCSRERTSWPHSICKPRWKRGGTSRTGGELVALDASTGTTRWETAVGGPVRGLGGDEGTVYEEP